MCRQWRMKLRCVLSVYNMTHSDLLHLICDNMPIDLRLDCKYIDFDKSIENLYNSPVRYSSKCKLHYHSSKLVEICLI